VIATSAANIAATYAISGVPRENYGAIYAAVPGLEKSLEIAPR
jgi:hypothetical protein